MAERLSNFNHLRLPKIYDSQMDALKASRKKSKKYSYSIKPTKGFYSGYQLVRSERHG